MFSRSPRILWATGTSPGSADVLVGMRMEKPGAPTSSSACEWKSQRGSRNVFSLSTHSPGDVLVGMRMEKPTWEPRRLFVVHAFSGRRGRHPPQVPTGTSALPADVLVGMRMEKLTGGVGTSFRCPRILWATGTSPAPGADGDVSAPCRRRRQRSWPTGTLALLAGVSSVLRVVLGLCHAAAEGAWCWLVFFQESFAHLCES